MNKASSKNETKFYLVGYLKLLLDLSNNNSPAAGNVAVIWAD